MRPSEKMALLDRKYDLLRQLIEIERMLANPMDNYFGSTQQHLQTALNTLERWEVR